MDPFDLYSHIHFLRLTKSALLVLRVSIRRVKGGWAKMLRFRPYLGMTIACAILFTVLCALGVRNGSTIALEAGVNHATVNKHLSDPPLSLDRSCGWTDTAQYRRVVLMGHFNSRREAYVFTTDSDGGPVYHALTPFQTVDGASSWSIAAWYRKNCCLPRR